jgi:ABC-2 type transport system permease protein
MPYALQLISNVLPARWFVDIVRGVMLKGNDLTVIWKNVVILFGMTILFILISVKNYKVRLE